MSLRIRRLGSWKKLSIFLGAGKGFPWSIINMKISRVLLIAAIASGLAVDSARGGSGGPAQSSESNTQLVIIRSPNIGYGTHFNIFVDSVRVANLGYGMKYEGAVTPGRHLITIKHMPHLDGAYPYSQQWITIVAGRPNVFTAAWRFGGSRIWLEGAEG